MCYEVPTKQLIYSYYVEGPAQGLGWLLDASRLLSCQAPSNSFERQQVTF